jgi:hypothetical protein
MAEKAYVDKSGLILIHDVNLIISFSVRLQGELNDCAGVLLF